MEKTAEVDLFEYLKIITKRKGVVIITAFVSLLAAVIITSQLAPVYETSAKLLISQKQLVGPNQQGGDPYQSVLLSQEQAKTFSDLIKGRFVAKQVLRRLDLPFSPNWLLSRITAEPVRDTQLIKITVEDNNAKRATAIANTLGIVLKARITELESTAGSAPTVTIVRVAEPASIPETPIKPRPIFNAIIGVLIGLTMGIGLAFLLERLDTTIKAADEVEKQTGLTSLGVIPLALVKGGLAGEGADPILAEAFRTLRTSIQYFNYNKSAKQILVTSPGSVEGKTTLATNLAVMLARAGEKVLVVDCDLRRPSVHELLKVPNKVGLTNMLADQVGLDFATPVATVDGLYTVTSGPIPPNPAELLGSVRMREFLKLAREQYDYVILDSPPVLAVTDATVLASLADGVLLVSSFGKTHKQALAASQATLEKVGARIFGFVINKVWSTEGFGYDFKQYRGAYLTEPPLKRAIVRRPLFMASLLALLLALLVAFTHVR